MRKVLKRLAIVLGGLIGLVVQALIVGFIYQNRSQASAEAKFPAPGELWDVGGRSLHLICSGEGSPTVILEAGGGSSSVQWWALDDEIAEFSRVCMYDRAGFGYSDPPPADLTFEESAEDLHTLLEMADVPGPYILVGHSKGGLHVRTYARLFPDEVVGVLLLDSTEEEDVFANLDFIEQSLKESQRQLLFAGFGIIRFLLNNFPDSVPLPDIPEELVEPYYREISRPDTWKAAISDAAAFGLTSPEMRVAGGFGHLENIPLIVITHGIPFTGGQAFLEPGWLSAMERLASLSSDSDLIVAENSGHSIMWDQPELVVEAIRALTKKAEPGS
ncbi:MAG: alpha/beta hydrolase [Actinobacteria bacterium]|nr:alpha/beta hydrolase [Actinomycetota bacterium]